MSSVLIRSRYVLFVSNTKYYVRMSVLLITKSTDASGVLKLWEPRLLGFVSLVSESYVNIFHTLFHF
jgi:hypothetical protein